MPVVEISALVLFGVVAVGNYVESWKQTSTKHRTRIAYGEIITSRAKLHALHEILEMFSKYLRRLTKEESEEYRRLFREGEKWTKTVRPRPTNVSLQKLEERVADIKAFVGSVEHFIEPYQKAVVGYSAAELSSLFKDQLPFSEIDF
ncbi:hypothetical protein C0993_002712, partial [Termitomyces sp. T159_Od127]